MAKAARRTQTLGNAGHPSTRGRSFRTGRSSLVLYRGVSRVAAIEGIELHLSIVLSGMQAVEIRAAVDVKPHRLAVDHEGRTVVAQRGLGDQRKPAAPVVAVAGEQAHALAVTLDDQAVTIVLDLVCQSGPAGTLASRVGMQGSIADLGIGLT